MIHPITNSDQVACQNPVKPLPQRPQITFPVEQPPICCLLDDLWITLIRHCDLTTVGMLSFTCHTLYARVFSLTARAAPDWLGEIFSGLVQQHNLAAIEALCEKIGPCQNGIELRITNSWHELPKALITIQDCVKINSLNIDDAKIRTKDLFQACSLCHGLQKLVLKEHAYDLGVDASDIPYLPSLEELQLCNVTFHPAVTLSSFFNRFPSLKRVVINDNTNIIIDVLKFPQTSNCLEYISSTCRYVNDPYHFYQSLQVHDKELQLDSKDPKFWGDHDKSSGIISYCFGGYTKLLGEILQENPYQAQHFPQKVKDYFRQAEDYLRQSIQLSPYLIQAKMLLADLLADTNPEEAEALLRKSIEICPNNVGCLQSLGRLLLQTNRTQEGIDLLEQLLCNHTAFNHNLFAEGARTLYKYDEVKGHAFVKQCLLKHSDTAHCFAEALQDPLAVLFCQMKSLMPNNFSQWLLWPQPAPLPPATQNELVQQLCKIPAFACVQTEVERTFQQQEIQTVKPWCDLFASLKEQGRDIRPLLDVFFIIMNDDKRAQLLELLAKPEWKEEREHFFRLLSKAASFIELPYCETLKKNDLVMQEFCELAREVCDVNAHIVIARFLSPALSQIKLELLSHALMKADIFLDSWVRFQVLLAIGEIFVEREDMKRAEKFFEKAAVLILTDVDREEEIDKLYKRLSELKILPKYQKHLALKADRLKAQNIENISS